MPEATIAQRIVRAKRTLTEARVPFEVPAASELATGEARAEFERAAALASNTRERDLLLQRAARLNETV